MDFIGSRPRPRMLISNGFDAGLTERLAALVPTSRVIASFSDVRAAEWDCYITPTGLVATPHMEVRVPRHLCVVYVDERMTSGVLDRVVADAAWCYIRLRENLVCNEFYPSPEGLDSELRRLVDEKLLPVVKNREKHRYFDIQAAPVSGADWIVVQEALRPFLRAASGHVLAGAYDRTSDGPVLGVESEVWLIPGDTPEIEAWVAMALRHWHRRWPERFPLALQDWERDERWQTPDEKTLVQALDDLYLERERVVAEFDERTAELSAQLQAASERANGTERRLLTEKGDVLKDAVIDALRELGFTVEDRDAVTDPKDRLEDLRLTDPDDAGWIALVEVRAYNGGAALNDALRMNRFRARYRDESGNWPTATWYVVSQFVNGDPGRRPPVLSLNAAEVAQFRDDSFLLLDTAQLFRLVIEAREGTRPAAEIRESLRGTFGRWD
jgi:hypothetical protein